MDTMNLLRQFGKLVIVGLIMGHIASFGMMLGFFRTIPVIMPESCHLVPGMEQGSEDIEILASGEALISSGLKSIMVPAGSVFYPSVFDGVKGVIFCYDLEVDGAIPMKLNISGEFDEDNFVPHGISVLENDDEGGVTLFVVNHHHEGDRVEVFTYLYRSLVLVHKRTVRDPLMSYINDVVALDEDTFYFSRYEASSTRWGGLLETATMVAWGELVFFNGTYGTAMVSGLIKPSGLATSQDKRYLYALVLGTNDIKIFSIDDRKRLNKVQEYHLGVYPDKIQVESSTGDIIVGSHPLGWNIFLHLGNPHISSPTTAYRLHMQDNRVQNTSIIFSDPGTILKAGSVAVLHKRHLLVGTIYHKMLHCKRIDSV